MKEEKEEGKVEGEEEDGEETAWGARRRERASGQRSAAGWDLQPARAAPCLGVLRSFLGGRGAQRGKKSRGVGTYPLIWRILRCT